jgi:hypothetical protein|tara:strand:- start:437 stop:1324 length:888 start_codon:yes stop_codon:yes gene_type:complete
MLPRGYARGLLNYQEKIDKQREKLQEKIDARVEKLQTLLATRSSSSSKAKTYTPSVIQLKNKLGNIEGSNLVYQAIADDPSSAPALMKKIQEAETKLNYELSPEQILEFFPILQTGSTSQVEGYMSTGDIVEAMKGDLTDNELYFKLLRGASTPAATRTGTTVFGDKFIAKSQPETVNRQTQEYQGVLLRMAQSDYDANKSDALLSNIRKATKDKNFSSLESSYGLRAVKEILDNPTPITRDIIMVNPTIRRVLESIPNNVKQDLIQNQNDAQAVAEFDEYFGRGAAQYIISRGG